MRASDIRSKPERIVQTTIRLADQDAFTVRFNANKITRAWADSTDRQDSVTGLYEALCDVFVDWDIVEDDGAPYPLTPAAMLALEFTFDQDAEIVRQIVIAAQPSRAEGNASANTSSSADTVSSSEPANPPNGHTPSPSHPLSAAGLTR